MDSKKSAFMEKMLKSINKTAEKKKAPKMSPFMARKKAEKEKLNKKPEKIEKQEKSEIKPVPVPDVKQPEISEPEAPKPTPKKPADVSKPDESPLGNPSKSAEKPVETAKKPVETPKRTVETRKKSDTPKPEPKSLRPRRNAQPVPAPVIEPEPAKPEPTEPEPTVSEPEPALPKPPKPEEPEPDVQKRKVSVDGDGVVKECKVSLEKLTTEQIRQFSPPPPESTNQNSEQPETSKSDENISQAEVSSEIGPSKEAILPEPLKSIPVKPVEPAKEEPVKPISADPVKPASVNQPKATSEVPVNTVPPEPVNTVSSEPVDNVNVEPVNAVQSEPVKPVSSEPIITESIEISKEVPTPTDIVTDKPEILPKALLDITSESTLPVKPVETAVVQPEVSKPTPAPTVEKRKNSDPVSTDEPPVKMAKPSEPEVVPAVVSKPTSPVLEPIEPVPTTAVPPVTEPIVQPVVTGSEPVSLPNVEPVNALDFLSDPVIPVSSESNQPVPAIGPPTIPTEVVSNEVVSVASTNEIVLPAPVKPVEPVNPIEPVKPSEPVKDDDDDIPLDALVAPAEPVNTGFNGPSSVLVNEVSPEKPVKPVPEVAHSTNISPTPVISDLVNNFGPAVPLPIPTPAVIPVPVPTEPLGNTGLTGPNEDNPLDLIFGGEKSTPENSGTIFDPSDIFGNNEPVQNPLDEILGFQPGPAGPPPVPIPSGPVPMQPNQPPVPPMNAGGISGPNSISPVDGILSMAGSSKSTTSPVEGLEDLFDDISKEVGKQQPNPLNSHYPGLPDFSGSNPLASQNTNQNSLSNLFGNNLPFPSTAIPTGVKSEPPLDPSKMSLFDKMSNFPSNLLAAQNAEKSKLSRPDSAISRLLDQKSEPIQKMAKDLLLQKRPGPGRPRKNPADPPREPKKRGPKPKKNRTGSVEGATLAELLKSGSSILPPGQSSNGPGGPLFPQNILAQHLAMANQTSQADNLSGNNIFNKVIASMMMNQPKAPTAEDIQRQAKMLLEQTKLSTLAQPTVPPTAKNLQSLLSQGTPNTLPNNPLWGGLRNIFSTDAVKPNPDPLSKSEPGDSMQTSTLSSLIDRTPVPGIPPIKSIKTEEDRPPRAGEKRKGPGRPKGSTNREKTVEGSLEKIRKARKIAHEPLSIIPPLSPPVGIKKEHKVIHSPNVREVTVLETPSGTLTLTPTKKLAKELSAKKRKNMGSAEKPKKRAKRSKSPVYTPSNPVKTGKSGLPKRAYKGRLPKLKLSKNQTGSEQPKWRVDYVFESKIPDSEIDCTPLLDRSSKRDYEKREAKRRGSAPELGPKMTPPPLQRAPATPGGSTCDPTLGAVPGGTSHVARILPTLSPAPSSNSSVDHAVESLKSPASVKAMVNHEPVRLKIRLSRNNNRPVTATPAQGQLRSTPRKAKSQVKYTVDSWWDDS